MSTAMQRLMKSLREAASIASDLALPGNPNMAQAWQEVVNAADAVIVQPGDPECAECGQPLVGDDRDVARFMKRVEEYGFQQFQSGLEARGSVTGLHTPWSYDEADARQKLRWKLKEEIEQAYRAALEGEG